MESIWEVLGSIFSIALIIGAIVVVCYVFINLETNKQEQIKEIHKIGTISDIVYNLNDNELTIVFDDYTSITINKDDGDYTVSQAHAMLKNNIDRMVSITYNKYGCIFKPIMVFD